MVAIKNIEPKELIVSFDGMDYYFPKATTVLVESDLVAHLKETIPLAFDFEIKVSKNSPVAKVKAIKTKSLNSLSNNNVTDMKVTQAGEQSNTFMTPEIGVEGAEFYGEGIEQDSI